MTLRLQDLGIATAYVKAAIGSANAEIFRCTEAIHRLREAPYGAAVLSEPETIVLLGQADFAAMVEMQDFSTILELHYPSLESRATAVNWVFSIPYELDRARGQSPADLRFILQLRFDRSIYVYRAIDEKIIDRLDELLDRYGTSARIHAGLGWSDLIIDGQFTQETFTQLISFIQSASSLQIWANGATVRAIRDMITVLGYRGETPPVLDVPHLTVLRAAPGHLQDVADRLRRYGDPAVFVDGKSDLVVRSLRTAGAWLGRDRVLAEAARDGALEKMETHLLTFHVDPSAPPAARPEIVIDLGDQVLHQEECGCEGAQLDVAKVITKSLENFDVRLLPRGLRQTTENILFLMQASTRERSICCDLRDAIRACHLGLDVLLKALEQKARETPEANVAAKHNEILSLWKRLDEWNRVVEILLRQRTIDSDIGEYPDRASLYSGGVQKFLFVADKLMHDFGRRVRPRSSPRFATVCDAVGTVLSLPTGIVRIPTTKIFALPLIVADLWHEVGIRLFLQEYAPQVARYAPAEERGEFLANVQDHYADIVVYFYGFRGDFDRFLVSLANRWQEGYGDFPYASSTHTAGQFLVRLYLVFEFHIMREAIASGDREKAHSFYNARETVASLTRVLRGIVEERFAASYGGRIALTAADWRLLEWNAIRQDFSNVQRALYQPLLRENVQRAVPALERFARGEIVQFGPEDDLNDYFAELGFRGWSNMDDSPSSFRMTAALVKSAEIEYHRRQSARSR